MANEADDVPGVGKVWKGFLTQLIISPESNGGLGLPSPYYSHITGVLKQVDAIRQLKRGGGTTPSEWLVLEMPDREMFDWKLDNTRLGTPGTRKATKEEILRKTLDNLTSGMRELRRRIDVLEGKG